MNIINRLLNAFESFPVKTAISENQYKISYKELALRSVSVANMLASKNIQRSCIAIEVANTLDHITAIIGVVLSGNFYVSITPENKVFFKEENRLPVKLCIRSVDSSESDYINILFSDVVNKNWNAPSGSICNSIQPEDNLCAFFTSGSTGSSKIVVLNHGTLYQELEQEIEENEIAETDKLDFVFSVSFSASLSCIFPALLTGAEVCIYNLKDRGLNGLVSFWEYNQITFSTLSVTAFQGVCKTTDSLRHLNSLRFVSISAEPVKDTTLAFFKEKFSADTVLQIAYASTETRTISDLKILNNGTKHPYPNSIGRPVGGKQVYILDEKGIKQPTGTVGEIMVESMFIANCYYGNEIESNHSFYRVGDIIQYKTGDLGYLNEEGYLFYEGRKTNEIKLNGTKINFANIEKEIEKLTSIMQAVVVINSSRNGINKLVCYFVAKEFSLPKNEIKEIISKRLPSNHIPQAFVKVDSFPLTHSGKINRKLLEKQTFAESQNETIVTTENNDIGYVTEIIDVYKKTLKINEVNADSNFFELGGDSFTSLLCAVEIENKLKINFPTFNFFLNPTPNTLNKYLLDTIKKPLKIVTHENINQYDEAKRNLYILIGQMGIVPDYNQFINSTLRENFNLICIYYDSKKCFTIEMSYQITLDQMMEVVDKEKQSVVLGFSFDGFIAHHLACLLPKISYCVLIDTFTYFDDGDQVIDKSILGNLKTIYRHMIIYKDFSFPLFIIKRYLEKKQEKKSSRSNNEMRDLSQKGFNYLLENIKIKTSVNNCIYFQASRHQSQVANHGIGWKYYTGGTFYFFNLVADHKTILKKHTSTIVKHINSITSIEIKVNDDI